MRKLAIVVCLAACDGDMVGPEATSASGLGNVPATAPRQTPPFASTPDAGINAAGLALQRQLFSAPTKNEVFSPASISLAFGMLAAGANGRTADQLYTFLHQDPHTAHDALGRLANGWNSDGIDEPLTLTIANGVWVDQHLQLRDSYLAVTSEKYGAPAQLVDFRGAPQPSRQAINSWVQDHTNDRIVDLIPEQAITLDTRLVLANAVHFRADWLRPFPAALNRDMPFTTAAGTTVRTPTMYARHELVYVDAPDARMVMLPYKGETLDFLVALPNNQSLSDLVTSMTAETVDGWVAAAQPQLIQLDLPKFKFSATYDSLSTPLGVLGVTEAFGDSADLSGISTVEDLYVSAAIHKAFIEVGEAGTEASAATAVVAEMVSGGPRPTATEFHVNEPFWFAVRDRATGTLLFTGQVADPTAMSQ